MTLKEEVQLGLTRSMRHPEIESLHLYEDELVLVVDPGHRFTRRGCGEPGGDRGGTAHLLRPALQLLRADARAAQECRHPGAEDDGG